MGVHRKPARRSWRWRVFRGCRIFFLSCFLFLSGSLLYFNQVGLPGFLERRLVAELRERGIELSFSRLRFRGYRGLVAETVSLTQTRPTDGPELTFREVGLELDAAALCHLRLDLKGLELVGGRLVLPLASTNESLQRLVVDHISTRLRFQPEDEWELEHFQADCFGASLQLSGSLSHASAAAEWSSGPAPRQAADLWQEQLRRATRLMKNLRFSQTPVIHLEVRGDARDLTRFTAEVRCVTLAADTPWGTIGNLQLNGRLNQPSGTNGLGLSVLKLEIQDLRTPWSEVGHGLLEARYLQSFTNPFPASADWDLRLGQIFTPWGETDQIHLTAHGSQDPNDPRLLRTEVTLASDALTSAPGQSKTNLLTASAVHDWESPIPLRADWQLRITEPAFALGTARELRLSGHLNRVAASPSPRADASWAWWAWFEPVELDWQGELDGLSISNVPVDRLTMAGHWKAPELAFTRLEASLYDRRFDATARVDVQTRLARAECRADFDLHQVAPLLGPEAVDWLGRFTWEVPPVIEGRVTGTLPAWTNAQPDWRAEVLPGLGVEGHLVATNVVCSALSFLKIETHFAYTNGVWHVPDFVGIRPDGRIGLEHWMDARTDDFRCKFSLQMDPGALEPLLGEGARPALALFRFTDAPKAEGEFQGRLGDPSRNRLDAHLTATNFLFRAEPISRLDTRILFTNALLMATSTAVDSGSEWVRADGVAFDFETHKLLLTNATARMDPLRIARAIGSSTERTLRPYLFRTPPNARVNGWVNVLHTEEVNMEFDLAGGPFTYWRFSLPQISAAVLWVDRSVAVSNVVSTFYGGRMNGDFQIDLTPKPDVDFRFRTQFDGVNFHALMADLVSPTNQLEGTVSGAWTVTHANAGDWRSWQGFGQGHLRDGFLWDIPLFGIFSPVLDTLIPGVGKSRVSGLTGSFVMTNSVIHTDDLELRSPAMRLAYRGTFDFNGNVDARVEARMLRDVWGIGPLVSLALSPLTKLFEYRVTGTLNQPQKEPLYIPKPFLFPLRPLQTLREMFGEEKPPPVPTTSPTGPAPPPP